MQRFFLQLVGPLDLFLLGGQLLEFGDLFVHLGCAGAGLIQLRIGGIHLFEIGNPIGVIGRETTGEYVEFAFRYHLGEIRAGAFFNLQIHPDVFQHFLHGGRGALYQLAVAKRDVAEREFLAVLLPDAVAAFGPAGLVEQLLGFVLVVGHEATEIILVPFLVLEQCERARQVFRVVHAIEPNLRQCFPVNAGEHGLPHLHILQGWGLRIEGHQVV